MARWAAVVALLCACETVNNYYGAVDAGGGDGYATDAEADAEGPPVACTSDEDCADPMLCLEFGAGGYCARPCGVRGDLPEWGPERCGGTSYCVPRTPWDPDNPAVPDLCARLCENFGECAPYSECLGAGYCTPAEIADAT